MAVSFKLIKDDKDISEKEGFGTIVVSSFLIVGIGILMIKSFNVNPIITGLTMLGLGWFGRPLTRKMYGDFAKKADIIGVLTLDTALITWDKDNSPVAVNSTDILSLTLQYNYIQGRQFAPKDIIHNGLSILTIQTKSNQTLQVKFLIETEDQLTVLKPIWKEYYRQGIMIQESMGKYRIKTIVFENADISYDRIQALKKELNVESFY